MRMNKDKRDEVKFLCLTLEKPSKKGLREKPNPLNLDFSTLQAKAIEYNAKNNLPVINKSDKTIAEIEDVIINKYGGKKLDTDYFYNHLNDFFGPKRQPDRFKTMSPCQIIYDFNDEIIPDEYFYSFYLIPLKDEFKNIDDYDKELITYITSTDGKFVYVSGFLIGLINSLEYHKKLECDIAFYTEGSPLYYSDVVDQDEVRLHITREFIKESHRLQSKVTEYNLKHNLPVINKNSKTIAQIEEVILNKYGGKKLDTTYFYEHLTDFFGPARYPDGFKMMSPCQIIFSFTEEIIPDKYFYSFYLIPLKDELKKVDDFDKELIAYITSFDGKFVYDSGFMTCVIDSLEFHKKLTNDIAYCADGVPIYFDYCNGKFQDF